MRNATLGLALAACAHSATEAPPGVDAAAGDARTVLDGAPDGAPDGGGGCAISAGVTPVLTGVDDLAAYPAAQQVALGAPLGTDAAAIAWDRAKLYVTVTSSAFTAPYEPLHVYVETAAALDAATPAMGKEYSGLVPALPFTASYLIAARRVSDSGTGAYDGVFTPDASWTTRATALQEGADVLVSQDQMTLSVAVPWSALGGCPSAMRVVAHVVHAQVANEWKDLVPATHTPWQAPGGDYYEIDLTGAPAVADWTLR